MRSVGSLNLKMDKNILQILQRGMKLKKKIDSISPELAHKLGEMALDNLGPPFREISKEYNLSIADSIQFLPVSQRCCEKRERLGIDVKEAARQSGVPQYRIKAVEEGHFSTITPETMSKYLSFLELEQWYRSWTRKNAELVNDKNLPVL